MKWHDKFIKTKLFHEWDWVLLYESGFKDFKGKICTHWMGPYQVDAVFDNGTFRLSTIDENHTSFLVNGHRLKLYHHPASKDAFVKNISAVSDLMVIGKEDTLTLS